MTPYFKLSLKVVVFGLILALLLVCGKAVAFDPKVDLSGGIAIRDGTCKMDDEDYQCFVIEKDKKKYLVVVDEAGILEVHFIKNDQEVLRPTNLEKLWGRPNLRNMV